LEQEAYKKDNVTEQNLEPTKKELPDFSLTFKQKFSYIYTLLDKLMFVSKSFYYFLTLSNK